MTPGEFVRKWSASTATERQGSQEHFIDLCRMLGQKTPNEADPSGDFYAFEKGAPRSGGGDGFADVWLDGHFGWEYKGKRKDLRAAYKQLLDYHEALGQPPLLVVCDLDRFEVHTKWINNESWVYEFSLRDLTTDAPVAVRAPSGMPVKDAPKLTATRLLRDLFDNPEALRPQRTTSAITERAVALFQPITNALRGWTEPGTTTRLYDDMRIARFIIRMVFCMFATDIDLLPPETLNTILTKNQAHPERCRARLKELWATMDTGGIFDDDDIPQFNGELFDDDDIPEHLTTTDIEKLRGLAAMNWADVEPAIFGTLFERLLDPKTRSKLGAHYTSREDIELLVEPVLMAPLRRQWEQARDAALGAMENAELHGATPETVRQRLRDHVRPFLDALTDVQVLDPACGSGNFLYVSLALLKKLEKEALAFAELYGVDFLPRVYPGQLHGIETNEYAHETANIVIWIGYLQWKYRNGLDPRAETPILQRLNQVELKDAILHRNDLGHPSEASWPRVDVIVGNPPFLGGKFLRNGGKDDPGLGDDYVDALFAVFDGRVKRESDLCCYWFEKARAQIAAGNTERAGLLATQAIRGGANRDVLQRIKAGGHIFFAVDDREWVLNGATVHVSMVGFDGGSGRPPVLLRHYETSEPDPKTGKPKKRRTTYEALSVEGINADLTSQADLTTAKRLPENERISFMGDTKVGPFEISESVARRLLASPNPDGRLNSDVVRPWANGLELTQRPRRMWIVDFPPGTSESEASMYEAPFEHIRSLVKPFRITARSGDATGVPWWIHQRPRPGMRQAIASHRRYLATPGVSKHRVFVWLTPDVLPDHALMAFARSDDYFLGVLQSRPHELWARATGTQLREAESGFRYTPTTSFETFPLPWSPGVEPTDDPRYLAVAEAAQQLNTYREGWLNPPPINGLSLPESELKKRTLTNLYNENPTWLQNAHRKLDEAVFAAYGWPSNLSDQDILARLLALNLQRAGASHQ